MSTVYIDVDPDPVKKTLISAVMWLLYDFFYLFKNDLDVPVPSKSSVMAKNVGKNYYYCILKATDEKGRIRFRNRIRTKMSQIHNTAKQE
jgi:hypothetical protein